MKKTAWLLALLLCVFATAFAQEAAQDTVVSMAKGLLTEVYGYTQEEAEAFTFDITQDEAFWVVRYHQNPAWVYKAGIHKKDLSLHTSFTPFTTLNQNKAPENCVRDVLHAVADHGWFESWNTESRKALLDTILCCDNIKMNSSMQQGLASDTYTPAQLLTDLFLSAYGEQPAWSAALSQWQSEVFETFHLAWQPKAFTAVQGIAQRSGTTRLDKADIEIYEFTGELPQILEAAADHPKLRGWACLSGACYSRAVSSALERVSGTGLVAFANGDQRMLVMLVKQQGSQEWQVIPVGEKALLANRDLYITYRSEADTYCMHYPVSDTQEETFLCHVTQMSSSPEDQQTVCYLLEYRNTDRTAQHTTVIDSAFDGTVTNWYHVTTADAGVQQEAVYPAFMISLMEFIDADAFPKTMEECQAAAQRAPMIPTGYGLTSAIYLRQDTSSHAKDLGNYATGTLVKILDTLPGTAYPWYHVLVGNREGYMSSNYVETSDDRRGFESRLVPQFGKTKAGVSLKESDGLFAKTILDLPAGTVVRVIGKIGNKLHVTIPALEDHWLMQPDEMSGYVKARDVIQAVTALQADWLLSQSN